jgi:hypothetical protein
MDPPAPIGWEDGWESELIWTQRLGEKSIVTAGVRMMTIMNTQGLGLLAFKNAVSAEI